MKALQAERDVAQRIVENVRQIHARPADDEKRSSLLWPSNPEPSSGGD
jgi:hypothetical protein